MLPSSPNRKHIPTQQPKRDENQRTARVRRQTWTQSPHEPIRQRDEEDAQHVGHAAEDGVGPDYQDDEEGY